MCLPNAAHEHFIRQTSKKSKTALKNLMGSEGREAEVQGLTYGAEDRGPRKQMHVVWKYLISCIAINHGS